MKTRRISIPWQRGFCYWFAIASIATAISSTVRSQDNAVQIPSSNKAAVNSSISSNSKLVSETHNKPKWSIAIHGGAGSGPDKWSDEQQQLRVDGLSKALKVGVGLLQKSTSAVDVVEAVIKELEDDPAFNAGKGTVLNEIGGFSLDACIMDGLDLSCGSVANITKIKNPISLARAVRDKTPHVFFCGTEADEFGISVGLPIEPPEYFITEEQTASWKRWKERQAARNNKTSRNDHDAGEDRLFYLGTVGCVVRDESGNLAAGTSTGGLLGKKYGRIGDSPIVGAGTYAKNKTCAVSCTGVGELFIRNHISSAISSRIEYLGESLNIAMAHEVKVTLPEDSGGIIAVDADGNLETQYNTPMMARGQANSDGLFRVGLIDWVEK